MRLSIHYGSNGDIEAYVSKIKRKDHKSNSKSIQQDCWARLYPWGR